MLLVLQGRRINGRENLSSRFRKNLYSVGRLSAIPCIA